jgi:hypothetical protein
MGHRVRDIRDIWDIGTVSHRLATKPERSGVLVQAGFVGQLRAPVGVLAVPPLAPDSVRDIHGVRKPRVAQAQRGASTSA